MAHTLLPKRIALPVYASDALSSVAYAPDEILLTLALAGVSAVAFSPLVGLAVMVVLLTVVASYRQNVHAYPSGGGDYEIANVNLGKHAGLTVASALLVDYVLTVAVSMSSAATYLTTAIPSLHGQQAMLATVGVVILALVNLRGVKEAGSLFAVPTYIFMASILGMTVMASARDLITIFVALEMLSIPAYLLAGWRKRDPKSNEAGAEITEAVIRCPASSPNAT